MSFVLCTIHVACVAHVAYVCVATSSSKQLMV